ncbi:MAG TPA: metallophosphoesterase [Chloroflexi bacterium]|jgi:Icc-related predicted phosphoesterase|nr:metallophosphoesterase [Chloroflexota bacterium]
MRILAVSDRIVKTLYSSNVGERYSDINLLIGCGDLPFYYLDFLVSALDRPLVYVRGNHDISPQYTANGRVLHDVPGGLDIHGRVVWAKGLIVAGLEGSMRYRPNAPYMYTDREMSWNVYRLIPQLIWNVARHGRYLDILVTHSPPYGIHDGRDLAHKGFRALRSFIQRFRPRYMLHGHVHVYRQDVPRITQFGDTTVINVYPYQVIEYK